MYRIYMVEDDNGILEAVKDRGAKLCGLDGSIAENLSI